MTEVEEKAALHNDTHKNINRTGKIMIEISGEGGWSREVLFVLY